MGKKMFFQFFIFSIALSLPSDIPPSQPFSEITDGKSYWSLSENFQRLSENYQSCLVQKAEIHGTLKEYQATFVNHVSEKLNDLKKDVKEISTSDLDHSEKINDLKKDVNEISTINLDYSDRIIVLEKSLTSISEDLSTLKSNFNAYQAQNDLSANFDPKEVYFNFGPKNAMQGEDGVMKFDEDRGSGKDHSYDPNTGYFTVKYEGLYFFSLSFLRWAKQSTTSTWADIKIDNEIGCRAYSDGDAAGNGWHRDTVSCSVVKRLKPGQKVAFVKNAGGLNRGPAEHPYTGCLGYMIR